MDIVALNTLLTEKFGPTWFDLENETMSLDLGLVFDELTLQKLTLLRVLLRDSQNFEHKSELFDAGHVGYIGVDEPRIYTDPVFVMHASDIINDIEVEPETIVMPTVLELAYTADSLAKLPILFNPAESELWHSLAEMALKEEGIDRPISPFLFVSESKFPERVKTEKEIKDILVACKVYIDLKRSGRGDVRVDV